MQQDKEENRILSIVVSQFLMVLYGEKSYPGVFLQAEL